MLLGPVVPALTWSWQEYIEYEANYCAGQGQDGDGSTDDGVPDHQARVNLWSLLPFLHGTWRNPVPPVPRHNLRVTGNIELEGHHQRNGHRVNKLREILTRGKIGIVRARPFFVYITAKYWPTLSPLMVLNLTHFQTKGKTQWFSHGIPVYSSTSGLT